MRSFIENVRIALGGLSLNKLRAALTTLGIAIGVAAVIVLVSVGQAVEVFVAEQFLGIGTNLIFVIPESIASAFSSGSSGPPASNRFSNIFSSLSMRDVEALSDPLRVRDAAQVVPLLQLTRPTTYGSVEVNGRLRATSPEYTEVRNRTLAAGRFFDAQEALSGARVAVLGQTTAENLFPPEVFPIGETIRIDGVAFRVIGILDPFGGASFGNEDDIIVVPLQTAQARLQSSRTLTGERPVTQIYVEAVSDSAIPDLVEQMTQVLREEHRISFRDEDDFVILTQSDLLNSFGAITSLLTLFLSIIAGISLVVGGIGIMNIMLVTVTERTREIGLRKAVGARQGDILAQFLVESMVLSILGGAAGIVVALVGTAMVGGIVPDLRTAVRLESVLLATTISALVGVFFGLYPARRASRLHPIDALRFE